MNIVWAAVVIVLATSVGVAAMLAVRRRAPEGGYFTDSDRAAGIFGVLAHRLLRPAGLHHLPRLREL